ncbi:MAG: hypothetical protein L6Q81_16455 [Bacteroidia bacterium]|nr:hypothetical protein [Bacteroidia bacterium]
MAESSLHAEIKDRLRALDKYVSASSVDPNLVSSKYGFAGAIRSVLVNIELIEIDSYNSDLKYYTYITSLSRQFSEVDWHADMSFYNNCKKELNLLVQNVIALVKK